MINMKQENSTKKSHVALIACVSGVVGGLVVWLTQGHQVYLRPEGMSYAELSAILLAVAALVVGVFGIAVGFFAIWGFNYFKKLAVTEARIVVEKDLQNGISKILISEIAQNVTAQKVDEEFQNGDAKKFIETQVAILVADAMTRNSFATAELIESRREEQDMFPEVGDEQE